MYANHRPAFGLQFERLIWAFEVVREKFLFEGDEQEEEGEEEGEDEFEIKEKEKKSSEKILKKQSTQSMSLQSKASILNIHRAELLDMLQNRGTIFYHMITHTFHSNKQC